MFRWLTPVLTGLMLALAALVIGFRASWRFGQFVSLFEEGLFEVDEGLEFSHDVDPLTLARLGFGSAKPSTRLF